MVVIRLCCLSPTYLSKPSLICDFCPSDQRFAYSFLQIPPRDGHPCCSAIHFPLPGCVRDFRPLERAHGAQTKRAPPGAPRQKGLEKSFSNPFSFIFPGQRRLPPPSPRKAQKRLGWEVSLAMMNRPPASTSSSSARLSHASPNILEECPHPPPWVRPPAAAPVLIQDMSKGRRR